jgi:hypothetical protein
MQIDPTLTVIFLTAILASAILATLAVLEGFRGLGRRKLFWRWRKSGSRWDRFLRTNADVNEALALLATGGLLLWALVTTATDGLTAFLKWMQLGALGVRAAWLILFLYVLLGTVRIISEQAADEVMPLFRRFTRTVFRRSPDAEEEAVLRYSYRHREDQD